MQKIGNTIPINGNTLYRYVHINKYNFFQLPMTFSCLQGYIVTHFLTSQHTNYTRVFILCFFVLNNSQKLKNHINFLILQLITNGGYTVKSVAPV